MLDKLFWLNSSAPRGVRSCEEQFAACSEGNFALCSQTCQNAKWRQEQHQQQLHRNIQRLGESAEVGLKNPGRNEPGRLVPCLVLFA